MIDVAIIGGGPAGAAAAIACARAGLVATLLERRAGPHAAAAPALADDEPEESIAPDSIALLCRLGVNCTAAGATFGGIASGRQVTYFVKQPGMSGRHVRRRWLDAELRGAASRAGAECRLGTDVVDVAPASGGGFVLLTSAGQLAARQLIDASGRRAWLARRLKLSRRWMSPPLIAWRDIVEGPSHPSPIARFVPAACGWTFSAQVSPGRVVRTRLVAARSRALRSRSAIAHATTWRVVRQLAGPGWFIAGDAAAVLDPAAGTGISFALRSGLAAGRAVAMCKADDALAPLVAARFDDALLREFTESAEVLAARYRELGITVLDRASGIISRDG